MFDEYDETLAPSRSKGRRKSQQRQPKKRSVDADFADYIERYGEFAEQVSDAPDAGDRWSTWDQSEAGERGPQPRPDWVITELAAVDTELGVLKTGKEADVFLVDRSVPNTDRAMLMAAKRYRDGEHRMFHRDIGYREGRRDKESRVNRAIAKRSAFGREVISGQWAYAEFNALSMLWASGVSVPYPVQILGTELLMEFIGAPDGEAASRLAQLRPATDELMDLWRQLGQSLSLMSRAGYAHGDLSAYNVLVHEGRLVIIDVPQIVDIVSNPQGVTFLDRDVRNVGSWFVARGLPPEDVDKLIADLRMDAGIG